MAFPYDRDRPASPMQRGDVAAVALLIARELRSPIFCAGLGNTGKPAPFMGMPKTPVNKNHLSTRPKH